MVVQHNLLALNADRQLGIVRSNLSKSTEKLTSGYRINRAGDDAAGLSISEKMRKQIRGLSQASENCEDGISLCQVADGALNETVDILQRMNELLIQAANGTNADSDREDIDKEVQQLKAEIDRIAETTSFNEFLYPLRQGRIEETTRYPLKTVTMQDVDYDDVKIPETIYDAATNTYVGYVPFEKYDSYDTLRLTAIIDDSTNDYPVDEYNLIYGNGCTSYSSIRLYDLIGSLSGSPITYTEIDLAAFTVLPDEYGYDAATKTWTRSFSYDTNINGNDISIKLTQNIQIDDNDKNYIITNAVCIKQDTSGNELYGFELLMNMDTAYNNNDRCEAYYANGSEILTTGIYQVEDTRWSHLSARLDSNLPDVHPGTEYPYSISIANENLEGSLPFTEKLTFLGSSDAPVISIGKYGGGATEWAYYDNASTYASRNQSTSNMDKTISLIWSIPDSSVGIQALYDMAAGNREAYFFTFKYGIDDISTDTNIPPTTPIKYKTYQVPDYTATPVIVKESERGMIKIQAGATSAADDGIQVKLVDATADGLGIGLVNSKSETEATDNIDVVSKAISQVSSYRSYFGAIQNRLEHAYNINENTIENTQYAESKIRDTDMADEMLKYSKNNILSQSGQSMLAQANQSTQGILSLIA